MKTHLRKISLLICFIIPAFHQAMAEQSSRPNDFPTPARAEFVYACMTSNGPSQETLMQCSCVIDTIAESMSYDEYLEAETVIRMQQVPGDRVAIFREAEHYKEIVNKLKAVQAQGEIECF